MYRAFFGFREKPFNLTPDPKFLYQNASYREALAALHYGIAERKGFVTLIGEAGTGKTTLLRRLLAELGPETRSVLVLNPSVAFEDLLAFILTDLGRPPAPGTPKLEMLEALNAELLDTLARGGNVVVLIDEAQDLGIGVLEELRLLSNLETAKEKILQFVLAGQPELDDMLERRELRQLRQRIAVFARLRPLARRELEAYVAARITAAGGNPAELFSRPALYRLWWFSGGVPRLVNVAGDNALVTAYAAGRKRVGWRAIGEAVSDLRTSRSRRRPRQLAAAALVVAVVMGVALGVVFSRLGSTPASSSRTLATRPDDAAATAPDAVPEAHAAPLQSGGVSGERAPVSEPALEVEAPPTDLAAASALAAGAPPPGAASAADPTTAAGTDGGAPREESGDPAAARPESTGATTAGANTTTNHDGGPGREAAAPLAAAVDREPSAAVGAKLIAARVEPGDSLTRIVRRYYGRESPTLIAAVRTANPEIADPNVVLIGQTVLIPDPAAHREGAADVPADATTVSEEAAAPPRRRHR